MLHLRKEAHIGFELPFRCSEDSGEATPQLLNAFFPPSHIVLSFVASDGKSLFFMEWKEHSTSFWERKYTNTQTHKYTNTNAQLQMHNYCPYILWNEKRTAPPFNENFWQRHFLAVSFKWAFKGYWMFYYSLQSSESLFLQVHDFVLILLEQRPKSNSNEGGRDLTQP